MTGDVLLFHLTLAASGARTSPGRAMLIFGTAAAFGGLVIFGAAHGPRCLRHSVRLARPGWHAV
jgi:hypothetical protein